MAGENYALSKLVGQDQFYSLAEIQQILPATSVPAGFAVYTSDNGIIVSNGTSWIPQTNTPFSVQRFTTIGSSSFTVPATCNLLYLSGCGGGGGGGGGDSTPGGGGGGGGSAVPIFMLPLVVTPGSQLSIVVGAGGPAGAANADGSDGSVSSISGAGILSPYKDGANLLELGFGGKGLKGGAAAGGQGGAPIFGTGQLPVGALNSGNSHAMKYFFLDGNEPIQFYLPASQGSGGGLVSVNGGSKNSNGIVTLNGRGSGQGGTGGASGGGGGSGGGSPYGSGGNGGNNGVAGTVGSGFGAGGGGGSGNSAGAAGTQGFIELIY